MELHTDKQDVVRLLSPGAYCVLDLPIRWGDCDAMQHVNNTVFFDSWKRRACK
jgi:acyl-ACP thioesterase